MVNDAPRFDTRAAARIARDIFGLDAVATPLTSERDQNFLLTDARGESSVMKQVLKIASASESRVVIEAQQAAMAHVAARMSLCPRPVRTVTGETIATISGQDGREHLVWAVTHLPGRPLGTVPYRSPALLEDFGRAIASLGCALDDFDHPALHRDFHWDLANGQRV